MTVPYTFPSCEVILKHLTETLATHAAFMDASFSDIMVRVHVPLWQGKGFFARESLCFDEIYGGSENHDPILRFAAWAAKNQQAWAIFNDGRRGHCFAIAGFLAAKKLSYGDARFSEVEEWLMLLRRQVVELPLHAPAEVVLRAPLLMMGYHFHDGLVMEKAETFQKDIGEKWGGGIAILPEQLRWRLGASEENGLWVAHLFRFSRNMSLLQMAEQIWERFQRLPTQDADFVVPQGPAATVRVGEAAETRTHWLGRVQKAIYDIRNSAGSAAALQKVVLIRRFHLLAEPMQYFSPWHSWVRLWRNNRQLIAFMIVEPSAGVFLGATPETLVHIEGKKIATHALAGTMPAVAYSESHLLENAKNHLEHKIVVQSILKRLGLHGAHSIKEKGLRVVRLPHVLHLETEILAEQVQAGRLLHWVKHLHPTPAVGGFPDDRALAYLREHEFCDRSLYASPLGWVNRYNEGTFSVALRSGFINKTCREAYAYAGVGIVAGSEPVSEWEEIALKLRTLCQALWTLADEGDVD